MNESLNDPIKRSLVRLRGIRGENAGGVVGAGFLVPGGFIVTCAHVLDDALGREKNTADQPCEPMSLDFPFSAYKEDAFTAEVIVWKPQDPKTRKYDMAVLALSPGQSIPNDVVPIQLALAKDVFNHQFAVYGFPKNQADEGQLVDGVLKFDIATGWIQVEGTASPGYWIQQGFSGAPVLDLQLKSVIGMIVVVEKDITKKVGYLIPTTQLKEWWGDLEVQESGVPKSEPATPRRLQEFWNGLKFIDYIAQQDSFRSIFGPGKALAFLIDGKPDYGHNWLVNRLIDQVPRSRRVPTCRVHLQSYWCPPSLHEVWTRIYRQLGESPNQATDVGALSLDVIKSVLNRLRYQSVVLVFLDAAYHGEAYLRGIIEEIWSPLAEAASRSQSTQNTCLVAFFVDEARPLPGTMSTTAPVSADLPATWHTARLPSLSEFSLEDVSAGVQVVSRLIPLGSTLPIRETASAILGSTQGVPGQVVKSLHLLCNNSWPEGAESWTSIQ